MNAPLQILMLLYILMPSYILVYLLFEYVDNIHDDHVFAQVIRHLPVMLGDKLLLQFQHQNQPPYLLSRNIIPIYNKIIVSRLILYSNQ